MSEQKNDFNLVEDNDQEISIFAQHTKEKKILLFKSLIFTLMTHVFVFLLTSPQQELEGKDYNSSPKMDHIRVNLKLKSYLPNDINKDIFVTLANNESEIICRKAFLRKQYKNEVFTIDLPKDCFKNTIISEQNENLWLVPYFKTEISKTIKTNKKQREVRYEIVL